MSGKGPVIRTRGGRLVHIHDVIEQAKKELKELSLSKNPTLSGFVHGVALAYNDITDAGVHDMDGHTRVLISSVVKNLENLTDHSHESVEDMLTRSVLVNTNDEHSDRRSDYLLIKTNDDEDDSDDDGDLDKEFVLDGAPTPEVLKKIRSWLHKVVDDKESLRHLKFDADLLKDIVIVAGKHVGVLKHLKSNEKEDEKPILDVSVLRFPHADSQYFKLFKLKISVKENTDLQLVDMDDKHALHAEYHCTKYRPNLKNMKHLDKEDHDREHANCLQIFGFRGLPFTH